MAKSRSWTIPGTPNRYGMIPKKFRKSSVSNTQPKPWKKPLAYSMAMMNLTHNGNSYEHAVDALDVYYAPDPYVSLIGKAYNRAYEQWSSNLRSEAAELLTLWTERRKTFSMIADRAIRLTAGLVAAKRGDVRLLKRLWGKNAGVRQKLRDGGSHVLEYSFGWAPLVSDIGNVLGTFRNGVPPSRVTGQFETRFVESEKPYNSGWKGGRRRNFTVRWKLGAEVSISDPNLALANQLGLLNPVATLWELTPWSFVVDYFINAQSFIGSFTDRIGYNIENEWATLLFSCDSIVLEVPPRSEDFGGRLDYSGSSLVMQRKTVINRPTLRGNPPWDLSWQRALTSVSLLLQQLKG